MVCVVWGRNGYREPSRYKKAFLVQRNDSFAAVLFLHGIPRRLHHNCDVKHLDKRFPLTSRTPNLSGGF